MNVTKVCLLSSPVELSLVIRCAGSSVHCFAPDSFSTTAMLTLC